MSDSPCQAVLIRRAIRSLNNISRLVSSGLVAPIVITALAYLHIIAAMGWLGGLVLFISEVTPGLRSLSSTAYMEFLSKVGPRTANFFIRVSTGTIVFGLTLLYFFINGDFSLLSFSTAFGADISVGLTLGLIAYLSANLLAIPALKKAVRLAKDMLASGQPGPPSPEFVKALRRARLGGAGVLVLLVITLMFMVASGFPF